MQNLLKFIKKIFPKTYNKLRKSKFLNNCFDYMYLFLFVLKRKKSFLRFFVKTTFSYYILRNKSDITFEFEGNDITMPRHLKGIDGFIEVWSDGFYDIIKGYNHVLDLGGYIGDSALKFAKNNKKVTVYEAHPDNYKYLKINTENLKNIVSYNQAVVGSSNEKFIKFYGGSFNMGAGDGHVIRGDNFIQVPAVSILDVLKNDKFDAIKMDIEGAEYACFDAILNSNENIFLFKEGFIEFHLSEDEKSDLNKINEILGWLSGKLYKFSYYDALTNKAIDSIDKLEKKVLLVHFYM